MSHQRRRDVRRRRRGHGASASSPNPVVPDLPGRATRSPGPAFHSAQWRHDVDLTRQAGRRRRHRRQRDPVRARHRRPGRRDDRLPALRAVRRAEAGPRVPAAATTGCSSRFPRLLAERRLDLPAHRAASTAPSGAVADRPAGARGGLRRLAGCSCVARSATRRCARKLRARTTRSAASGCCSPTTGTRPWTATTSTSSPSAVDRRRARGVRTADGTLHEADVLIWGTGFAATDVPRPHRGAPASDGVDLHERLGRTAPTRTSASTVPGLPQPVLRLRPEHQPRRQLDHRHARGAGRLDRPGRPRGSPTAAPPASRCGRRSSEAYDREMQERLGDSVWSGCDSWYTDGGRITTNWPGTGRASTSPGCARSTGPSCEPAP